tara:strand:+ start:704 stop:1183 length:480 start_codon:yes stop_codon:yes gene_type:complete
MSIQQKRETAEATFMRQMQEYDYEEAKLVNEEHNARHYEAGTGPDGFWVGAANPRINGEETWWSEEDEAFLPVSETVPRCQRQYRVVPFRMWGEYNERDLAGGEGPGVLTARNEAAAAAKSYNKEHVENMVELIDEVKHLVPDQKYIQIMELLSKMHAK